MSEQNEKPHETGVHSVSPHLICKDAAKAIEFYRNAFGATEMMRLEGPNGKLMHGCVCINGSSVMLVDEAPEWNMLGPKALKGTPVTIHLIVDDADAFAERAVKAGVVLVAVPGCAADRGEGDGRQRSLAALRVRYAEPHSQRRPVDGFRLSA